MMKTGVSTYTLLIMNKIFCINLTDLVHGSIAKNISLFCNLRVIYFYDSTIWLYVTTPSATRAAQLMYL